MNLLENLKRIYLFNTNDKNLARGLRSGIIYIYGILSCCLTDINPGGLTPFEYLSYARQDLHKKGKRAAINSVSNLKRAIHLTIDSILRLFGVDKIFWKSSFPEKLDFLNSIEAFPTSFLDNLNKKRNIIEHKYRFITHEEAAYFADICEMFLRIAFPILRRNFIGVHVGIKNDDRCIHWILSPTNKTISIFEDKSGKKIKNDGFYIHYDFRAKEENMVILQKIRINKKTLKNSLRYLNTMMYWTNYQNTKLADSLGAPEFEPMFLQSYLRYFIHNKS